MILCIVVIRVCIVGAECWQRSTAMQNTGTLTRHHATFYYAFRFSVTVLHSVANGITSLAKKKSEIYY